MNGKKTLYLDELPPLKDMTGKVVLVGCSLSDRIFKSHYKRKIELLDICPEALSANVMDKLKSTVVLMKCCKLKDSYEIEQNVIKVPWGTTSRIIEDALNDYFARTGPSGSGISGGS